MAFIHARVFDLGLNVIDSEATHMHITSSEPANYAAVAAAILATKATPTIDAPVDNSPSGRKVVIPAQSFGNVINSGTASHWVIVDATNSRILVSGALSANQALTAGNPIATTTNLEVALRGLT